MQMVRPLLKCEHSQYDRNKVGLSTAVKPADLTLRHKKVATIVMFQSWHLNTTKLIIETFTIYV